MSANRVSNVFLKKKWPDIEPVVKNNYVIDVTRRKTDEPPPRPLQAFLLTAAARLCLVVKLVRQQLPGIYGCISGTNVQEQQGQKREIANAWTRRHPEVLPHIKAMRMRAYYI